MTKHFLKRYRRLILSHTTVVQVRRVQVRPAQVHLTGRPRLGSPDRTDVRVAIDSKPQLLAGAQKGGIHLPYVLSEVAWHFECECVRRPGPAFLLAFIESPKNTPQPGLLKILQDFLRFPEARYPRCYPFRLSFDVSRSKSTVPPPGQTKPQFGPRLHR